MEIFLLTAENRQEAAELFASVFTGEPWGDDWSDREQLDRYLADLMDGPASPSLGLRQDGRLIALSLGSIRHYWSGTVYCVDEFCVAREAQGQGIGTRFLAAVEKEAARRGAAALFLQTDRQMPAFAFYGKNGYRELGSHVSMKKTLERSETI